MNYVALLRGINVGGNNKVEMGRLKKACQEAGLTRVSTYINSGNVLFSADEAVSSLQLAEKIESAIEQEFGLAIKVVVVARSTIEEVVANTPADWVNDSTTMKCDVLFLWPDIDKKSIIDDIISTPTVDDLLYYPGAVVWKLGRENYSKSGMHALIGTEIYKKSTIRNINTVRKLDALLKNMDED